VTDERQLVDKLLRIEALFARAGTDGEKVAAAGAAERIRRRLEGLAEIDPPVEYRFSVSDGWSRKLLLALLRRYGIKPYRYRNQRRSSVMARVSRRFVQDTLWPEFEEFSRVLEAHLSQVTDRIIAQAVSPESEEEEVRVGETEERGGGRGRILPSPEAGNPTGAGT
jgi:hypothetical protein